MTVKDDDIKEGIGGKRRKTHERKFGTLDWTAHFIIVKHTFKQMTWLRDKMKQYNIYNDISKIIPGNKTNTWQKICKKKKTEYSITTDYHSLPVDGDMYLKVICHHPFNLEWRRKPRKWNTEHSFFRSLTATLNRLWSRGTRRQKFPKFLIGVEPAQHFQGWASRKERPVTFVRLAHR